MIPPAFKKKAVKVLLLDLEVLALVPREGG
jgi:hypothetical protein